MSISQFHCVLLMLLNALLLRSCLKTKKINVMTTKVGVEKVKNFEGQLDALALAPIHVWAIVRVPMAQKS